SCYLLPGKTVCEITACNLLLQSQGLKRIHNRDGAMEEEVRTVIPHPARVCTQRIVARVEACRQKQRRVPYTILHRYFRLQYGLICCVENFHVHNTAHPKGSVHRTGNTVCAKPEVTARDVGRPVRRSEYRLLKILLAIDVKPCSRIRTILSQRHHRER